jgi:hypothetical protein
MCLRALSYGPETEIVYTHDCPNAKEHSYSVNIQELIKSAVPIDPTTREAKFKMTLGSGQTVFFHPPVYQSVVELYQGLALDKTGDVTEEIHNRINKSYAAMIDNVDGTTDKTFINEWLNALPGNLYKEFTDKLESVGSFGLQTLVKRECRDCGAELTLEANTNPISFFI